MLREATIDDAAAAVQLLSMVQPEWVFSVEGFRHSWANSPPEARRSAWCIEEGDEVIAWGTTSLMVETSEPGVGGIGIDVHPERRRAGLGSALIAAAERHASEIGVTRLLSFSRGDEASASFAHSKGYEQTASNEILVVDPRDVEPPVLPEGVELKPYTAFVDDPWQIYHVFATSVLDVPGEERFDTIPYEYWLDRFWRHPSPTATRVRWHSSTEWPLQPRGLTPTGRRAAGRTTARARFPSTAAAGSPRWPSRGRSFARRNSAARSSTPGTT